MEFKKQAYRREEKRSAINIENPKGIFKKYKREDKNTGGHGLGLAIVSDICKKYNFEIEVLSQNSINTFRYILKN